MSLSLLLSTVLALAAPPDVWRPTGGLVVETESERRRVPITPSALLRDWVALDVDLTDRVPTEGDTIIDTSGAERTWAPVAANDNGALQVPRQGWALITFDADEAYDAILDPGPSSLVFVNGMPRAGDTYNLGLLEHPMRVRAGRNTLLYALGRGAVRPVIRPAETPVSISERDRTLPHIRVGEPVDAWAGLVVLNTSAEPLVGATAEGVSPDGRVTRVAMPRIEPYSAMQTAFRVVGAAPAEPVEDATDATDAEGNAERPTYPVTFIVRDADGDEIARMDRRLQVRSRDAWIKRTYRSAVDGSVQYYAMLPAIGADDGEPRGLVMSLHGAGVEASGQITHYLPQEDAHTVATTNRRRFGFDHEDWGRMDLVEVMADVGRRAAIDPDRVRLTGHSMGGHGTWINGLMDAQRFAALGPSSGWASFWTYGQSERIAEDGGVQSILRRAANVSDTLLLMDNARRLGIYVLHAQADRNVPVREARAMRERLGTFHTDWAYYERPGARHWWGSNSLRWPPMIDFLMARTRAPADRVDFTVVDPHLKGVTMRGVRVLGQETVREPSRIDVRWGEGDGGRTVTIATENVRRLQIDARDVADAAVAAGATDAANSAGATNAADSTDASDGAMIAVDVDGTTLEIAADAAATLVRDGDVWRSTDTGAAGERAHDASRLHKSPRLPSGFKIVYDHRPFLVYGTAGDDAADAWGRAKTRFDAETFRYRGNGRLVVISDIDYLALPTDATAGRNVVLYGNADTNRAWATVVPADAPFDVRDGMLRVGDTVRRGDDLALMLSHPDTTGERMVGVVAGTGPAGRRATTPMRFFLSGAHFPDWTVCTPAVYTDGWEAVIGAGFFDDAWQFDAGQSAWRDD